MQSSILTKASKYPLEAQIQHANQVAALVATNKIIEAANPILLFCTRLTQGFKPYEDNIQLQLAQELTLFLSKCKKINYSPITVQLTHQILAGTLIQLISNNNLPTDNLPTLNNIETDRLERVLENAKENIEVLELAYVCYQLGFEQISDFFGNRIYNKIREIRGEPSKALHVTNNIELDKNKLAYHKPQSLIKNISVLSAVSLGILIIANFVINENFTILNQQLQSTITMITTSI